MAARLGLQRTIVRHCLRGRAGVERARIGRHKGRGPEGPRGDRGLGLGDERGGAERGPWAPPSGGPGRKGRPSAGAEWMIADGGEEGPRT